jgi:hypothetical protein
MITWPQPSKVLVQRAVAVAEVKVENEGTKRKRRSSAVREGRASIELK